MPNRSLLAWGFGLALVAALAYATYRIGTLVERRRWDGWVAKVDTVYFHSVVLDTLYLTVTKPHWDTVKFRDTITINKVVYVPLAPADSTIKACEAGYATCRAARDQLFEANSRLRSRLASAEASAKRCGLSVSVGAGMAATYDLLPRSQVDSSRTRMALGPSLYAGVNLACKKLF